MRVHGDLRLSSPSNIGYLCSCFGFPCARVVAFISMLIMLFRAPSASAFALRAAQAPRLRMPDASRVLSRGFLSPNRQVVVNQRPSSHLLGRYFRSASSVLDTHSALNAAASVDSQDRYQSPFMREFVARGYLHQCTDLTAVDKLFAEGSVSAYIGFDATAPSFHVGSLLQIMILRMLQRHGHQPIVLIGGGTTRVGDPSGKDKSRQMLTDETIQSNIDSLSTVFSKYIDFSSTSPNKGLMVNNADWLKNINYIDFLRDYGRYFSVNRMLTFDSVKTRLAREDPLSFLEFNYMILQAYDFMELKQRHNVSLQIGGSDQWGNIVSGIELARKARQMALHGLTAPLVTTASGSKMGKTESGAVWLNRDLMTEFDYWQFWRNTADADVIKMLKLFTEVPLERIKEFEALSGSALNEAKVLLADEATRLLHGDESVGKIKDSVKSLYGGAAAGGDMLDHLDSLEHIQCTDASIVTTDEHGSKGVDLAAAMVAAGLSATRSEARRSISGGAVRVGSGVKADGAYFMLRREHFDDKGRVKLSVGKKKHVVFVIPLNLL